VFESFFDLFIHIYGLFLHFVYAILSIVFQPNALALSRLAGCAHIGSVYINRHRRL
jgi:hypothetical protein